MRVSPITPETTHIFQINLPSIISITRCLTRKKTFLAFFNPTQSISTKDYRLHWGTYFCLAIRFKP